MRKLPPGHWLALRDGELDDAARSGGRRTCPSTRSTRHAALDALDRELRALGRIDAGRRRAARRVRERRRRFGAHRRDGTTDFRAAPIDTFNLGFTGHDVGSEHVEAARVAQHIGSRHHCLMLAPDDVLPALDRWVDVFDEPFGDQAALPTMLLAGYARRDVTVVLTGEGADEVFGGYGNYVKRVREERITALLGARGSPLPWLVAGPAAAPRTRPHRQG